MKKLLSLLVVFTAVLCFASEAKAGLSFSVSVNAPYRSYRSYDGCYDGYYRRPVVYHAAPVVYRRPRVVVYEEPVYYSRPRYREYRRWR
ncbi:MAG TPA: hypothetical protein VF585_00960 [Chthoniobacterales bacterium]|jgi:hypothetical protein